MFTKCFQLLGFSQKNLQKKMMHVLPNDATKRQIDVPRVHASPHAPLIQENNNSYTIMWRSTPSGCQTRTFLVKKKEVLREMILQKRRRSDCIEQIDRLCVGAGKHVKNLKPDSGNMKVKFYVQETTERA